MITDYMQTPFTLYSISEAQVGGRLQRTYTEDSTEYYCAIFTPSTTVTVSQGKRQFIIEKNLYCEADVPVKTGDYVEIMGVNFDVISINNTNNLNHHLVIGLVSRVE